MNQLLKIIVYVNFLLKLNSTVGHSNRGLAIRGFDYLQTQKLQITRENYHFKDKLA